jgi:serine/threonine protein kinase
MLRMRLLILPVDLECFSVPISCFRRWARESLARSVPSITSSLTDVFTNKCGQVKLGVHHELGEEVAVKLIKRSAIKDKERAEGGEKGWGKVKREVEVLKVVKHPNIVSLYDVIETEKYIGIVLEYASGQ